MSTYIALREFFMMHYMDDCNTANGDEIALYGRRASQFLLAWETLVTIIRRIELDGGGSAQELRTAVYDAGKAAYDETALRNWFQDMNLVLFNRKEGPQLHVLIDLMGTETFISKVNYELSNYIGLLIRPTYNKLNMPKV